MNREEALGHIFVQIDGTVYPDDVEDLINSVYNDFESMTCENCKYFEKRYEHDGIGECNRIIINGVFTVGAVYDYDNMFLPANFGCNKWERK